MTMAMYYLSRENEYEILVYLCNRMREFDCETIEFWLPQMVSLCLESMSTEGGGGPCTADFIVDRCKHYVSFSLRTTWWLKALIEQGEEGRGRLAIAQGILERIYASAPCFDVPALEVRALGLPSPEKTPRKGHCRFPSSGPTVSRGGNEHGRSESRAWPGDTNATLKIGQLPRVAALSSSRSGPTALMDTGHAFDWPTLPRAVSSDDATSESNLQQECGSSGTGKHTAAPVVSSADEMNLKLCMKAQLSFITALMQIGNKLRRFRDKDVRRSQLLAELALMNLNLPARVYLPLSMNIDSGPLRDHHVVRLPPPEAAILNSRDRVPYLLYVEVLVCEACQMSPVPRKMTLKTAAAAGQAGFLGSGQTAQNLPVAAAETQKATDAGVVAVSDIRHRLSKASRIATLVDANDPSAKAFREPWVDKLERIRIASPYGHLPNWKVVPIIVKNGDDLRQEVLASQLMVAFQKAWNAEQLKLWIKPLGVVVTDGDGGMIEVVGSGVSLHQIKRNYASLLEFLRAENGGATSAAFARAQRNFTESLAGYSLFCYFLQVKDRHNSNILLDGDGHIIHIDFGFMLSAANSPGGGMNFEKAPFKLTLEFIEVMGGPDGDMFQYFRTLVRQGFVASRKHMGEILPLLEIILPESKLPCLVGGKEAVKAFEDRFCLTMTEEALTAHVEQLVEGSLSSLRTQLYDQFQYLSNGIR